MRDTYKELHLGTFTETFLDFCKKVLLPVLVILTALYFAFFESRAYAKEEKKEYAQDSFYLIQDYFDKKSLGIAQPYRLSCIKGDCTLAKGKSSIVVQNFFADKKCKKVATKRPDLVFEYVCSNSKLKRMIMPISGKRYFQEILSEETERESSKT